MKTIIIIAFILITSTCYGEDTKTFDISPGNRVHVTAFCMRGYVFVLAKTQGANGISIVQLFESAPLTKYTDIPQPVKCKRKP